MLPYKGENNREERWAGHVARMVGGESLMQGFGGET